MSHLKVTRDGVIFVVGVLGILWETLAEDVDRPYLLLLYGAMIGLPIIIRTDEKGSPQLAFNEEDHQDTDGGAL